jgi:hypothetical protein
MFFVSTEPLLPDQQWHYSASKLLADSNDRSLLSTLVEVEQSCVLRDMSSSGNGNAF